MYAAFAGHEGAAALLLDAGADVDVTDSLGMTALMKAAFGGHPAVVQLLLKKGADANARDDDGLSAREHAALSPDRAAGKEVIRVLDALAGP